MGYTLNEQTEELTLCVKRGKDSTIAEYIMKPGEMAFDKTNCILKINREDVTMKAYVINLKEEYDFLQGG